MSTLYEQPLDMPERLESGTVNTLGIIGLAAGIKYINFTGLANIYAHEIHMTREIHRYLSRIEKIVLYTPFPDGNSALPVLSFNIQNQASEETVAALSEAGFALRGGLHCSPLAHKKIGTVETGTARISISALNTIDQAEKLCLAIRNITQ